MPNTSAPLSSLALCKTYLRNAKEVVNHFSQFDVAGRVTRVAGLVIEATGIKLPMGSACIIALQNGEEINAEIVGFDNDKVFLMPQSSVEGLLPGTPVYAEKTTQTVSRVDLSLRPSRRAVDRTRHLPVGYELLGRVLDGAA